MLVSFQNRLMSTCGLRCISQEVDKVSVSAEVHHGLVFIAHLFTHERGQGLVKPLNVLQLGESVGDDTLALMLPQCQQQLRKKIIKLSFWTNINYKEKKGGLKCQKGD